MVVLFGNLGIALVMVLAVAGPLLVGRWLAERDDSPDPEVAAIEAHALMLLAGTQAGVGSSGE